MCAFAVCSAMRYGRMWARRRRTSRQSKKRPDGAMFGRGRRLMPTRNCASRTTWATVASIRHTTSCAMPRIASLAVRRSQQTRIGPIYRPSKMRSERKLITRNCIRFSALPTIDESRYSPATCIGCEMKTVMGDPDPKHVSTCFVERQNLSMRMGIRRFTRLTNAFSKKVENHAAAVALWFGYYNLCRVHQTLRVTPAMEANLSDHVWSIAELVSLPDNS